jgi:hypothetical protein
MDDQRSYDSPEVQEMIDLVLSVMPDAINGEILIYLFISIIYAYGMEDQKKVFAENFSTSLMQTQLVRNSLN